MDRCELSHVERTPIDVSRAARQHGAYERALRALGCRVVRVPLAADQPDSVFVEDTAVVVDEVAVMARPGAEARRGEVDPVATVLADFRPLRVIEPPGTLDGGDVLRMGRTVWVGVSRRTNPDGAAQLRRILEPLGYEVILVPVDGCLHLKTAVTALPDDAVLINRGWVDARPFSGRTVIEADPAEPFGANVLRVEAGVVVPAAHRRTRERLEGRGIRVVAVDVSEIARAEGGVTCCSILLSEGVAGVERVEDVSGGP